VFCVLCSCNCMSAICTRRHSHAAAAALAQLPLPWLWLCIAICMEYCLSVTALHCSCTCMPASGTTASCACFRVQLLLHSCHRRCYVAQGPAVLLTQLMSLQLSGFNPGYPRSLAVCNMTRALYGILLCRTSRVWEVQVCCLNAMMVMLNMYVATSFVTSWFVV
jgi:hypothetical protein